MLATNVSADTDGENSLSKKNSGEVKDCFESVNRATFKFNQVLDNIIFEPVANKLHGHQSSLLEYNLFFYQAC